MQRLLAASPDSECYPSSFRQVGRAGAIDQLYSPGVCPDGYASAQTGSVGGTTTVVCCLRYGSSVFTSEFLMLTSL